MQLEAEKGKELSSESSIFERNRVQIAPGSSTVLHKYCLMWLRTKLAEGFHIEQRESSRNKNDES